MRGTRSRRCRHAPSTSRIGIHQVAVAQNRCVVPFRKGNRSASTGLRPASPTRQAPASVEMAIAPMLIQYGGGRGAWRERNERDAGEKEKRKHQETQLP